MDDAHHLHDTTDAATWAKEFCKRWPSALCEIPGKKGVSDGNDFEATMIGWFANAIMAGVDSEARKAAARIRELEAQLAAPAVKVKPLVWEDWADVPVRVASAQTILGRYKVQERASGAGWMLVFPNGNLTNRDTIEAAKAAAQADYEARILAAIEAVPVAEVDRLLEAMLPLLRFAENTESELGIVLDSADRARGALAAFRGGADAG
jgi:hypothetical protein